MTIEQLKKRCAELDEQAKTLYHEFQKGGVFDDPTVAIATCAAFCFFMEIVFSDKPETINRMLAALEAIAAEETEWPEFIN